MVHGKEDRFVQLWQQLKPHLIMRLSATSVCSCVLHPPSSACALRGFRPLQRGCENTDISHLNKCPDVKYPDQKSSQRHKRLETQFWNRDTGAQINQKTVLTGPLGLGRALETSSCKSIDRKPEFHLLTEKMKPYHGCFWTLLR